tara:strand:+ start:247 stop:462 length:216 start_codon:yes stop_codon:yes gene_type:complete
MKNSADQRLYDHVDAAIIELWKEGRVVRSTNPDMTSGEYRYAAPKFRGVTPPELPEIGPYLTYKEFQSQLN